jgi:hypothetical protein
VALVLDLRSDGSVVAWGADLDGQFAVPGRLNNVVRIDSCGGHSNAVTEAGSLIGWYKRLKCRSNLRVDGL